jgi:IS1 family transposase
VKPPGKLTVECDEAWSFVNNKGNKQWTGKAFDAKTREILGVYIGDRSSESALKLWNSLPPLQFIVSVQFVTQISGMLIKKLYQRNVTKLWEKIVAKLIVLKNSITL